MLTFDEKKHEYSLDGVLIPSVTEIIKPIGYNIQNTQPWDTRYKERGTAVHEATMLIDYGEEVFVDLEISGYINAYLRFLADYAPKWEYIEVAGYDPEWMFAGTIDRVGEIDGETCIIDIKTGQLHDSLITAQLTAYARIYRNGMGEKPPKLYGLKLAKDGTYILKQYQPNLELLSAARLIYNETHHKKRRTK